MNTASIVYGIRSINTNIISGKFLYTSANGKGEANHKIKEIVSIPSRRINIDREYKKWK